MNRTTLAIALVILLIGGALVWNYQRDQEQQRQQARDAAEAELRTAVAGCGQGTGRWGGRVLETRDNATGQIIGKTLILDNNPAPGESEAVLKAWLECHRTVDQDLHETLTQSQGQATIYYRITDGWGYSVENGRIACVRLGGQTRCAAPK